MRNKSDSKNSNKKTKSVSIGNLELNAFHTQVTNKLKDDKIRLQNLYRDELILELEKIKNKEERLLYLRDKFEKNQIDHNLLKGMHKENEMEILDLKIVVIEFIMKNVNGIKYVPPISKDCFHLPGTDKSYDFINNAFNHLIHNRLISSNTSKSAFKSIFNRNIGNKKINWTADISQLYYFILLLIKLPGIFKSKKWITTCKCFTLKEEELQKERFHSQKIPKKGPKTEIIEAVFKKLS